MQVDVIEARAALSQGEHRHRCFIELLAQTIQQGHTLTFHHQVDGMALGTVNHHLSHPGQLLQHPLRGLGFLRSRKLLDPQRDPVATQLSLEAIGCAFCDHPAAIKDREPISQRIDFF